MSKEELQYGDEVVVMISADQQEVRVLEDGAIFHGYGHLSGQGSPLCPRLQLKDGRITYGCLCWWGAKEGFKNHLAHKFPFATTVVVEPDPAMCEKAPDPNDPYTITDVVPKGVTIQ